MDHEARQYVATMLPVILSAIAEDRGCQVDDLSVGVLRACENFGLACFREGYDHAHDEVTVRIPREG